MYMCVDFVIHAECNRVVQFTLAHKPSAQYDGLKTHSLIIRNKADVPASRTYRKNVCLSTFVACVDSSKRRTYVFTTFFFGQLIYIHASVGNCWQYVV